MKRLSFVFLSCLLGGCFVAPCVAKKKPKLKLGLLKMQCDQVGMSLSCAQAGVLLEKKKKFRDAARYYKKACFAEIKPRGTPCYLLGLLITDKKQSLQLFRRGCKLKDADSCTTLGERIVIQKTVKARTQALGFYRKGCKLKDGRGCHRMARILFLRKKPQQAALALKKSCRFKYAPGCGYLGWFWETKRKDRKRAEALYRKGCRLKGGSIECGRLGLLLARKGKAKEALRFLRKSCRRGFSFACSRARLLAKTIDEQVKKPRKR